MNTSTALARFARCGIVVVLRGTFPPDSALPLVETLIEAGLDAVEFTTNSAQAFEAMQAVRAAFGPDICAGMGTVLDAATAQRALDAGADFMVAPSFSPAVVAAAQAADRLIAPGVITPTECVDAWALGVPLLKLFPIGALGLDYFKTLRGPLNHMAFMCNGSIDDSNTGAFIQAGALACGTGWPVGDGTWPLERVAERARRLRGIVDAARSPQRGTVV
jgi:2-dehydro-3-deoxyphosphogluconate aldolase/(4S)-4-hydroxy-2-oxoglutarate aldolase